MIRITAVLAALALALAPSVSLARGYGGGSHSGGSSSHSSSSHSSSHSSDSHSSGAHSGGSRSHSPSSHSYSHSSGSHSTVHHSTSGSRKSTYSTTATRDKHGKIKRSQHAKSDFKRSHPSPSTGRSTGACPGYVIDHVQALKHGGADAPSNMQWQTKADAKAKDRWE